MDEGSTREEQRSNNLDDIHYCLTQGCEGVLEEVDGSHDDLKIEWTCSEGCRNSECLTQMAWN